MPKIQLYFRTPPETDRFLPGDRYLRPIIRRLLRGKKTSGIRKVFENLCLGFDQLGISYAVNTDFNQIQPGEPVVVLGLGRYALDGYDKPNPVIAGIGLMTHPSEWPDLFDQFPVAAYLQHSAWTNNLYAAHYGAGKCKIWPAGIGTNKWAPDINATKQFDILIYNKVMWDKQETYNKLVSPIIQKLEQLGLSYIEISYGSYNEREYFKLLNKSRAMIFLCEHESQGFACCEAMAMNVPILAWDQGHWLDPNRFAWGDPNVPATSVPYFDDRCGMKFINYTHFEQLIDIFWDKVTANGFCPRDYVLENLTLEKSAQQMLEIISQVYA